MRRSNHGFFTPTQVRQRGFPYKTISAYPYLPETMTDLEFANAISSKTGEFYAEARA